MQYVVQMGRAKVASSMFSTDTEAKAKAHIRKTIGAIRRTYERRIPGETRHAHPVLAEIDAFESAVENAIVEQQPTVIDMSIDGHPIYVKIWSES